MGLVVAFCFSVDGADDKFITTQKDNAKPIDVNRAWSIGFEGLAETTTPFITPMARRDGCEKPHQLNLPQNDLF